mgnify:CR=1 FL=1
MTVLGCQSWFLRKFDAAQRMNRWYAVRIQPTLLDPVAVICSWGSGVTAWEQSKIMPMASWEQARTAADNIVKSKIKRGYWVVSEYT